MTRGKRRILPQDEPAHLYIYNQTGGDHRCNKKGAAIAYEGERDPDDRQYPGDHAEVYYNMPEKHGCYAEGQEKTEPVF